MTPSIRLSPPRTSWCFILLLCATPLFSTRSGATPAALTAGGMNPDKGRNALAMVIGRCDDVRIGVMESLTTEEEREWATELARDEVARRSEEEEEIEGIVLRSSGKAESGGERIEW